MGKHMIDKSKCWKHGRREKEKLPSLKGGGGEGAEEPMTREAEKMANDRAKTTRDTLDNAIGFAE